MHMEEIHYGTRKERAQQLYRRHRFRAGGGRQRGRIGKSLAFSLSGGSVWRRHFYPGIYYSGADVWFYPDGDRDRHWTENQTEPGTCL